MAKSNTFKKHTTFFIQNFPSSYQTPLLPCSYPASTLSLSFLWLLCCCHGYNYLYFFFFSSSLKIWHLLNHRRTCNVMDSIKSLKSKNLQLNSRSLIPFQSQHKRTQNSKMVIHLLHYFLILMECLLTYRNYIDLKILKILFQLGGKKVIKYLK